MTHSRTWFIALALAVALLASVLLAGTADAQAPAAAARAAGTIRALEQAIETRGAAIALPAAGIGTVTVTPCERCPRVTMLAGNASAWLLGERAVRFDELRRALQADPRARVVVFYRAPGGELTRMIAQVRARPAP